MEENTTVADIHQEAGPDTEVPNVELGKDEKISRIVYINPRIIMYVNNNKILGY